MRHTPVFESSKIATESGFQSDEPYVKNQPALNTGLDEASAQFGGASMQTNLHSSLHVGFPGSAMQAPSASSNQATDLHVGHPAPAGPPLSASQLYDLLNSFPQITEQYASGQHPQLQQHLLQQQLGHLLPFSQPQMHSFNYNEQVRSCSVPSENEEIYLDLRRSNKISQYLTKDRIRSTLIFVDLFYSLFEN